MKRLGVFLCLLWLLIASGAAVSAAAQQSDTYRLGAGDVLEIAVWGHNDLAHAVTVRPDGRITFPLVGDVQVIGLTPPQVKENVTTRIAEYVRDPQVTVTVREFRTIAVQVVGMVRNPGLYRLRPGSGVADVIAAAGGLASEADFTRVQFVSTTLGPTSLDLESLFVSGEQAANRTLGDGDQVIVPAVRKVAVMGEVHAPGLAPVGPRDGIQEILARAGGTTPGADLTRVEVTAYQSDTATPAVTVINLVTADREGQPPVLPAWPESGRLVVRVPKTVRQVTVLGQVQRPGAYAVDDETRLTAVIGAAGGPTKRASLARVRVYRGGESANPQDVVVGRENLLFEGDAKDNPRVRTGDVVFVPETKKTDWDKVIKLLTGLTLLKDLLK